MPKKQKIKLPAVKGRLSHYPERPMCPWCGERRVMEPHSMAILRAGALARNEDNSYSGPNEDLKAYLQFHWHGAHDDGEGDYRDTGLVFDIAQEVDGGMFDLMFCSVDCMRAFLNACLDQFEQKVKKLKPIA